MVINNKKNGIRVALVTCHDKRNYGSVLQAFATQKYLADLGYEVRTIDKTCLGDCIKPGRMEYYRRHIVDIQMYREKAPFVEHRLRQKVSSEFKREMAQRYKAFDEFARKNFRLTRKAFSFEELRNMSREYDVVVVGSDQLWLPVNISGGYFTLEWVDQGVRKVSYSTSIGLSSLDDYYLRRLGSFLSDFNSVSVRENSGASLVERATGNCPEVTCDPTMLLTREQWSQVANGLYDDIPDTPYLLCYFMGDNQWQRKCAVDYAHKHNLKIVAIAHNDIFVSADNDYADYYPWDAGPAEWLALFENASFVCTDSFHGSVFANIFQIPFISFRRHVAKSKHSTNTRIDTLLGILGLGGRLCESGDSFSSISETSVDFGLVGERLENYRSKSAAWLNNALEFPERKASAHIEIFHVEDCCGCAACANACPKDCVEMVFDQEGCEYPRVDESECVKCGKCLKACPIINSVEENPFEQKAFLVQHKNPRVLAESTSGGAFSALAEKTIVRGGIVFGSGYSLERRLDAFPSVACFGVDNIEALSRFRNSKYVQSEIGLAFREVKEQLASGREVLFSGTPCHCEALLAYLGCKPSNLCMTDVVCRAVPCRAVFRSYCQWLEGQYGFHPNNVRFRDKRKYGYRYSNICSFEKGGNSSFYTAGVESDPMLRAFFANICNRPCCYTCRFKKRYRQTDLTLWDCFDIYRFSKDLDNNKGVTRVLVHTLRGANMIDDIIDVASVVELDPDLATDGVQEMFLSAPSNDKRLRFMEDIAISGSAAMERWFPDSIKVKTERGIRLSLVKIGIYDQIKRAVKRLLHV